MKTVKIECFDPAREWYPIFSLEFTTVEWKDLLQFVNNNLDWPQGDSAWLKGIKAAIDSIKSGYFDSDSFYLKAKLV